MTIRIGIDVGGTFTDLVAFDPRTGALGEHKVLTTPHDPTRAILDGLGALLERTGHGVSALRDATLVHGTTLATNALIERRGARTALLTSGGARDILETGRESRYDPYDRLLERPAPLVPRPWRRTVSERLLVDGTVRTPIDRDAVGRVLLELAAEGVEAVAVCLLHSFIDARHERVVREVATAVTPELVIALSSEVAPEVGEFDRATTTVVNAYIQPMVAGYLRRLEAALRATGHRGALYLMGSDGGLAPMEAALRAPIRLLESGPAAGALAAGFDARAASLERTVAFDMGGTTTKVCLIRGGAPEVGSQFEAARIRRDRPGSGLTLRVPSVRLLEIGAGGGSLAGVDAMGLLTVGPRSAGSDPGPACYGLGGDGATVTDANLVLGYLAADAALAGGLDLDLELARQALAVVGERLGLGPEEAAQRVRRLINEAMAQAIRLHATERGEDPRDFQLTAFGGAAPLHAYDVARSLGMRRVRWSARAGVLSAFGFLTAPVGIERVQTLIAPLAELPTERLATTAAALREHALADLGPAGLDPDGVRFSYALDLRYLGQGYDVSTPIDDPADPDAERIGAAFEAAYRLRYRVGHRGPVQIRALRLRAQGPDPTVRVRPPRSGARARRPARTRRIWFDDRDAWIVTPAVRLEELRAREPRAGPLVIEADHTTYVVGPASTVTLTTGGDLVMEVAPREEERDPRAPGLEIAIAQLRAVADEADRALQRTAFSSVVREARDYSLVITDPHGRCLGLPTECMPLFVTSMPRTVRLLVERFPPETLEAGDALFTNDPWLCAGHKSDLVLVAPVFHGGEIVAFVGAILHVSDIGGALGDFRAWDLYEEGLAVPPLKLYRRGVVNSEVEAILLANVRSPEEVRGDVAAMRTAIEVASQRLRSLLSAAHPIDLAAVADEVGVRAEGALRRQLERLPEGDLHAGLEVDGPPGDTPDAFPPVRLALRAAREDGALHLDFAGSDPQHPSRAINVPLSYTVADAIYGVQYLLRPDMPNIGPQFSPVRVSAPEGSILNALPPVPVYARTRTGLHIGTLISAALAPALPEAVQAASGHAVILSVMGRRNDGSFFKVSIMPKGGMGASGGRDGWSCTEFPTNSSMIATETAEGLGPILLERELRRDSGGAGRERGGLGQLLTLTSLAEVPLLIAFRPNFVSHPPIGLLGGRPGAAARIEIDGGAPRENPVTLAPGGVLRVWTAGGGGIGDPLEREIARVVRDVASGRVSAEMAREVYGVIVDPATGEGRAAARQRGT